MYRPRSTLIDLGVLSAPPTVSEQANFFDKIKPLVIMVLFVTLSTLCPLGALEIMFRWGGPIFGYLKNHEDDIDSTHIGHKTARIKRVLTKGGSDQ